MNSTTHHPLHDHTWRDIGGPIGMLLDGVFCAFIIVSALGMVLLASFVLLVDHLTAPILALASKARAH
jgi:hypothetical protein